MKLLLSALALCASSSAFAFDFTEADGLFNRREEGINTINSARQAYIAAAPSVQGPELIYAIEQVARLDAYAALSIPKSQITSRKPILENCLRDVEKMSPSAVGETPHYYYWKSICQSLWAEADGVMSSLRRAKDVFEWLDTGRAIDATYEAGGFDRIAGGLYLRLPAINPFGPGGSVEKALSHLEASLNAPAYGGSKTPDTDTGDYHFTTHYYYAETLIKAERRDEAITFIDQAIARIESGDLPVGREPETRLVLQRLKELKDSTY